MREALCAKARVVACKNRAQLDASMKMSSDAVLARMLQKAEDVVRKVRAILQIVPFPLNCKS